MKKIISLIACIAIVFSFATVSYASDATNFAIKASATEVNEGDTFTVTLSLKEAAVVSIAGGFYISEDSTAEVTCTSVKDGDEYEIEAETGYIYYAGGRNPASTTASMPAGVNDQKVCSMVLSGTGEKTYTAQDLLVATFTATKAGTVKFSIFETSDGTNGKQADGVDEISLTIKGSAPADPVTVTGGTADKTGDKDDTKVWAVAVAGDQVNAGDTLTATLSYNGDTQIVPLTVNVEGGADWSFNLRVRFKDCASQEEMNAKRDATTLTVVKAAN